MNGRVLLQHVYLSCALCGEMKSDAKSMNGLSKFGVTRRIHFQAIYNTANHQAYAFSPPTTPLKYLSTPSIASSYQVFTPNPLPREAGGYPGRLLTHNAKTRTAQVLWD